MHPEFAFAVMDVTRYKVSTGVLVEAVTISVGADEPGGHGRHGVARASPRGLIERRST
jgi:hypothetical protein